MDTLPPPSVNETANALMAVAADYEANGYWPTEIFAVGLLPHLMRHEVMRHVFLISIELHRAAFPESPEEGRLFAGQAEVYAINAVMADRLKVPAP